MSGKTEPEDGLLNASELEMTNATRSPAVEQLSAEQLKALVHRLRQAHAGAKEISARQQREMRGKAEPHGTRPAQENAGSVGKAQALMQAIQRADAELTRRQVATVGTPSQADLARHALELKLASEGEHHPDAGRSASDGMHAKDRTELMKVGTTRKEIGRVSQANKVAQARKDGKG